MCEVGGLLTITYEDNRGYIKGRIGHQGYYVPAKGGARMAQQARANVGQIVNGTTIRGMLVRIDNGESYVSKRNVNRPRSLSSNFASRLSLLESDGFLDIGGYAWRCRSCGVRIYATSRPRFCPSCRV